MKDQLGIKALRPGPSGNESAPNHANYDEALANPYPNLPDVLTLKNGKPVKSAAMWTGARQGDRRGVRSRGARPRAEERADGHLDRDANGRRHGRRTRRRRAGR